MKIIILHGDDSLKSYERLTKFTKEAKNRGWEVTDYNLDSIANQSLFGTERFYILKDYKLLTKKDILNILQYDGNLIIYNEGNIPALFLKTLPKDIKIEKFELPRFVFKFADSFYPTNANACLKLLHELSTNEPIELTFFWLTRHVRDLYWVRQGKPNYPDWRLSKLKSQSNKFTDKLLKEIIADLSKIDVKVKTSKANLKDSLDLLIVKKLA
jgi:DNA polymerase III delta subunit